ncbi:DUF4920 domain-containing protein [Sabulilitoribacter arenilitoris]|uniref:DUF4920 domain-containing protein n=1 Tax=Wocania arenilitoris TaxID=2044858 RepID=A0AAE3EPK2_9FLAO|nr:DUF4920 domain-containing protein [Wocania arenilitoris]MCF7567794.1 DUF4920 domain-containing protein [Wocania arenilitoris]
MKPIILLIICVFMLNSCKNKDEKQQEKPVEVEKTVYKSFGNEIIADDAIDVSSMATHYKSMNVGDSINSKITATVNKVCQAKGCWMTLNLGNDEEVLVKFKDYAIFMPKDIAGKEVIINGKAFVKEVSVDEQRHYAEDGGKTPEEIVSITEPKRTYSFEADGVLLKQ